MPALVTRLLAAQFPRWADLPVTPVQPDGWDNTTLRVGTELAARMPSADGYIPQVEKVHRRLGEILDEIEPDWQRHYVLIPALRRPHQSPLPHRLP